MPPRASRFDLEEWLHTAFHRTVNCRAPVRGALEACGVPPGMRACVSSARLFVSLSESDLEEELALAEIDVYCGSRDEKVHALCCP
jgi:hypothetical protein